MITWLTVGLVAGVLASTVMRDGGLGLRGDIALGVAGAIVGGWTFQMLGWQPSLAGLIAVALVGAVIALAGQRLLRAGRFTRPGREWIPSVRGARRRQSWQLVGVRTGGARDRRLGRDGPAVPVQ